MISIENHNVGLPYIYQTKTLNSRPLQKVEYQNLKLPLCPKCGDTKHCTDGSYESPYGGVTIRFWCTKCQIEWDGNQIRPYRDLKA